MELKTFDILLNEAVEELNEVSLMDLPDFDGTYVLKKLNRLLKKVHVSMHITNVKVAYML